MTKCQVRGMSVGRGENEGASRVEACTTGSRHCSMVAHLIFQLRFGNHCEIRWVERYVSLCFLTMRVTVATAATEAAEEHGGWGEAAGGKARWKKKASAKDNLPTNDTE